MVVISAVFIWKWPDTDRAEGFWRPKVNRWAAWRTFRAVSSEQANAVRTASPSQNHRRSWTGSGGGVPKWLARRARPESRFVRTVRSLRAMFDVESESCRGRRMGMTLHFARTWVHHPCGGLTLAKSAPEVVVFEKDSRAPGG